MSHDLLIKAPLKVSQVQITVNLMLTQGLAEIRFKLRFLLLDSYGSFLSLRLSASPKKETEERRRMWGREGR